MVYIWAYLSTKQFLIPNSYFLISCSSCLCPNFAVTLCAFSRGVCSFGAHTSSYTEFWWQTKGKQRTVKNKLLTTINMKKHAFYSLSFAGLLLLSASFLFRATAAELTEAADLPAYYAAVDGQSGKNLFDEVHTVAKVGYKSLGYDGLWTAYKTTDVRNNGQIWDMYSDCSFTLGSKQCGNYKNECDCYNREHSIPKSWFGGTTSKPGCDIFHLVPTDGKVNGMRSNYPFGEVKSATYTSGNGSQLGSAASITVSGKTVVGNSGITTTYSNTVFEPVDEYKGDFARGYLGTMIRWANGDYQAFTQGQGSSTFSGDYTASGYFGLTKYGVALLLKWHREDPVSQKEIDRNNGIQQTQGNRNPFIDYPYLVEYIWGKHAGETVKLSNLINSSDSRFVPGQSDGYAGEKTAVEEVEFVPVETTAKKVLRNGQLLIIHGQEVYNAQGQLINN